MMTFLSSRLFCLGAVIVYSLSLLWLVTTQRKSLDWGWSNSCNPHSPSSGLIGDAIPSLFRGIRVAVDADNFTGLDEEVFHLPSYELGQGPRFQKPLGRRLLILDADTRELDGPGGILNTTWSDSTRQSYFTGGRLGHYMFAKIHGYDYKLVQVQNMGSRYGTWAKVPAIREFLEHYQFVVFLDADVILTYPHLPLEWLFNYWAMHPQTLVAMAADPTEPVNDDERGNTFLNTGFVIAQRSVRTMELLRAWENCPGESQYQNCAHWVTHWPHEQGAFGTYLRYDFNRSSDIKVLPCAEANGCPNAAHTGCVGKFVRHYWYSKNSVTPAVDQSIQRYFLPYLHHAFLRDAQLDVLALEPENMAQD